MPERKPPEECANCGAAIPRSARACPECGADERSGWRETDVYDGLDLPAEAYGNENSSKPPPRRREGVPWYWWCVAVVLVVLLAGGAFALF